MNPTRRLAREMEVMKTGSLGGKVQPTKLSSRPEIVLPAGKDKRSGGTARF